MISSLEFTEMENKKALTFEDLDHTLTYSYADYLGWNIDPPVELLNGKIFKKSLPPTHFHESVITNVASALYSYLKHKPYRVCTAPFNVRFFRGKNTDENIFTVLQPDISVVCDPDKLDDRGCLGAPDIIAEILTNGNNKKELLYKYSLYEEFGVREYWVISPGDMTFLRYTLNAAGKYVPSRLFTLSEEVYSDILPGFILNLDDVFEI